MTGLGILYCVIMREIKFSADVIMSLMLPIITEYKIPTQPYLAAIMEGPKASNTFLSDFYSDRHLENSTRGINRGISTYSEEVGRLAK